MREAFHKILAAKCNKTKGKLSLEAGGGALCAMPPKIQAKA